MKSTIPRLLAYGWKHTGGIKFVFRPFQSCYMVITVSFLLNEKKHRFVASIGWTTGMCLCLITRCPDFIYYICEQH